MKKDRKTVAISVRLTEKELTMIQVAAEKEFDFPSSWIRRKIMGVIENEDKKVL